MTPFTSRAIRFAALTALAGAALSACTAEPEYPIEAGVAPGGGIQQMQPRYPVTDSTPPERAPAIAAAVAPPSAPASEDDAPRAAPSADVSSISLAPPDGATAAPASSEPSPRRVGDSGRSPGHPIPYAELTTRRSGRTAAGSLRGPEPASPVAETAASPWPATPAPALETPGAATVRPGETLYDVAERTRTPLRAIVEANGLRPPYGVRPGAVLRIPPPLVYRARAGDTLYGIGGRFSIDPPSLANLNDISPTARLSPGQPIALPSLAQDRGINRQAQGQAPAPETTADAAAPTRSAAAASASEGAALRSPGPRPYASVFGGGRSRRSAGAGRPHGRVRSAAIASTPSDPGIAPQAVTLPPPSAAPPSAVQVAGLGRGRFVWPVRGAVLSGFGDKAPGQRNDGLNIAANLGDPVKASAAGEVVYAGDQIPGFGNLVLVKHTGGWVTAYAHLSHIDVRMKEAVSQGEALGEAGQTGTVDRPQLHFEIRYAPTPGDKARPVDPAALLPAAG